MDAKRTLFLLQPDHPDSSKSFKNLQRILAPLDFESVNPATPETVRSLDGHVLVIPAADWPEGVLSGFTRCEDLLAIAIVSPKDDLSQVKLWYQMGAQLVLDEAVSPSVLLAAVERLLEVESESWRPKLTKREAMIFDVLRKAAQVGLNRADIARRVWDDVSVQQKTIDVHIFNLRRKLGSTRYRISCADQRFYLIEALRLPGVEAEAQAGTSASEASNAQKGRRTRRESRSAR